MKRLLESAWLSARLEAILGFIFIYASIHKIADPPDFAHMIFNYKLTPCFLINLLGIYLPWIELVAGAALVLGIRGRRGGAAVVGALLLVFIGAIGINLIRGNAIDCGCFEGSSVDRPREELIFDMWVVLIRDVLMLIAVVQILAAARAVLRKKEPQGGSAVRPEAA